MLPKGIGTTQKTLIMRLIVNCPGGASHSLLIDDSTTVMDAKVHVAAHEGTPASNQALLFAGRPLAPDAALLLPELRLDAFSMGHEVVVYMQPLLTAPVRVYVTGQHGGSSCASSVAGKRLHLEHVEAASSMANIQALLVTRGLTCAPFPSAATRGSCTAAGAEPSSSDVVVNRADGSCCARVRVNESSSLQELVAAIWQAEGVAVSSLTFYQAHDGCLHAMFGAAARA